MTDVYVAGLGVRNVDQLTQETEQAIRGSQEVLYVDTGIATQELLERWCPRVTPLYLASYVEGGNRVNAYQIMAARVVDAAMRRPPVTFAMHGHPIVGAYAPFLIRDMAGLLGLNVQVLPGVSALDCLFAELTVDPCVLGMQMVEATDLLLRRRPLQPDVPALIWQIGNLETRLHSDRVSRPERFERFTRHLLQFYPADHEVTAVYCSPHPLVPTVKLRFALGAMADHAHKLHAGFTLYVPPSSVGPIQDLELLRLLDSEEHLRRITRQPASDRSH